MTFYRPGLSFAEHKERLIREAFDHFGGNRTAISRALGVSIRVVRHWVHRYGLPAKSATKALRIKPPSPCSLE